MGARKAAPILLQGLEKLEYRGYDSAGIALLEKGRLEVIKTRGRIAALRERVEQKGPLTACCGIGHTRWATHGEPSELNAHPHVSDNGRVALVHNGIIENYQELREMLRAKGFVIRTQTDSEVAAHLFQMNDHGDSLAALRETMKLIRGSYALGVVTADAPDELVCARQDSPLILGLGEGETMIASDIPAILAVTRRYVVLEDGQAARVRADGVEITDIYGRPVEPRVQTVNWDISAAEKGGYRHFMMKEIMEQPKAVRDTVSPRLRDGLPDLAAEGLDDSLLKNAGHIHITACGSALHAGLVGKAVIEKLARVPVTAQVASEFRYSDPIIGPGDLCIVISQSGETADTLAALREAKRKGAKTIAIVNVVSSSAAREADAVLYTWAGPEIAVATTKAYSAQLAVLYLIAVRAALARGNMSEAEARELCAHIAALPDHIREALDTREEMARLASLYANRRDAFFLGRGLDYAAGLLANQNVYIAGQFRGAPRQIVLNDRFGPVEFTLLPFVRAATVRHYMPEADLPDYDSAVAAALSACAPSAERRVLVAHQMVVAGLCPPQLSGSETAPLTVGTVDSVDAAHFAGFSYTALGHIHRAQRVGSDTVRYAGAPLCYHLDECGMEKSATLVRLGRRGVDGIDTLPLHPRRAMRHIVGPLAKLVEHPADTGDYIWATLTDPTPQPDAMAMLRTAYPNAMRLDYRPQGAEILPADTAQSVRGKPFASLFEDFFTQMNGRPLTVEEARAVKALREEASK